MLGLRISVALGVAALILPAVGADKKPLDPSVYDGWNSIRGTALSRDGHWLLFSVTPQEGDSTTTVRNLDDGHTITVPRGSNLRFTADSKFAVGMIVPPFADTLAAKRKKAKPDEMPKSSLVVVNLATGDKAQVDKVRAYYLAEDDKGWLAYKLEPEPKPDAKPADAKAAPKPPAPDKKPGQTLVIRNLATGKEEQAPFVSQVVPAKHGGALLYATATKDGKGDGVTLLDFASDKKTPIMGAAGDYTQMAIDAEGRLAAFEFEPQKKTEPAKPDASKPADKAPEPPIPAELYLYEAKTAKTERIGVDAVGKGWQVNDKTPISFSERGTRLLYATYPAPPTPAKELPDDQKVSVDIWSWQDSKLMPVQLLEANTEKSRGYRAIYDVDRHKAEQIADRDLQTIEISDKGDGRFAIGSVEAPYDLAGSWDPGYRDEYLIDLSTNKRTLIGKRFKGDAELSPKGEYVAVYDAAAKSWFAVECATGRSASLSAGIPVPLYNELNDLPDVAAPYGLEGWMSESQPVIADRFDLWQCDATGKQKPQQLTHARQLTLQMRAIKLDPDAIYLPQNDLLISAFDDSSKQGGVYQLHNGVARKLIFEPKAFGGFVKAKNADRLLFTQQDFVEYPDLWVTNLAFSSPAKVSDANPQQKDYNWGKAELVQWTSLDGVPLQGILIKPENFDYGKKYPLVTNFYERLSDRLYHYITPSPSASEINPTYFASNGYCVFIPDIPYRIGYPGYSALSAIVPGVQSIVNRGYIDPKRLGIQGQSWGGYQVAYLVTQTNMFAAAEAGAPVGDMFAAYGGIRYGSGLVREMQYEHGQSRIGGTPWDSTLKYIENSPVFFADKVQTPLMIMSNDQDGAVPHTQGIELFTALRRLEKPCWMVVYNGEDHNIMERKNRKDFGVRLSQYFDHFLKGAPMPVWMAQGIPAVDKGRTMGLDLEKGP